MDDTGRLTPGDALTLTLPMGLKDHLAAHGAEQTPDVELYAQIILGTWAKAPEEDRDRFAQFFMNNLTYWLRGEPVDLGEEGGVVAPTQDGIRHALWMVQGLVEPDVAQALHRALPDDMRARVDTFIENLDEWPTFDD